MGFIFKKNIKQNCIKQYKRIFLLFGIYLMFGLFLSSISVHALNLANYPDLFIKNNVASITFILGKSAMVYDGIAASLIVASLQKYYDSKNITFVYHFTTDFDVGNLNSIQGIVLGGACANSVTSELYDYPLQCSKPFIPGKGIIKFSTYSGSKYIIVAGYYWQDTMRAASVLSQWQKYNLSGVESQVNIVKMPYLFIN